MQTCISAPSQSFLRRVFAIFLNVFDTSSRAIVVLIELVHCSEITTVAQAETFAIADIILKIHRLFSTGVVVWEECARLFSIVIPNWAVREAHDPVGLVVGDPAQRLSWHLNLWSVAGHAHFIQGDDVADALWKTIRRHKALVTTLQGHL